MKHAITSYIHTQLHSILDMLNVKYMKTHIEYCILLYVWPILLIWRQSTISFIFIYIIDQTWILCFNDILKPLAKIKIESIVASVRIIFFILFHSLYMFLLCTWSFVGINHFGFCILDGICAIVMSISLKLWNDN